MSFACHLHFICIYSYFFYMFSYVIRISVVRTRMSCVCHSYVLVYHSYVTRLWFYHEPMKTYFCGTFKEHELYETYMKLCFCFYQASSLKKTSYWKSPYISYALHEDVPKILLWLHCTKNCCFSLSISVVNATKSAGNSL